MSILVLNMSLALSVQVHDKLAHLSRLTPGG